jgi:hypothetical protein
MSRISNLALSLPLLAVLPLAAYAQTEVLDFTGLVTSASPGVAVGTAVSGTYDFSLNPTVYNGYGGQVTGSVGSKSTPWSVTLDEFQSSAVYSSTVQVAGGPNYVSDEWLYGTSTVSGSGHTLQGSESTGNDGNFNQSSITLDPRGTSSAFLADGLPNVKSISLSGSTGMFQTRFLNGNLDGDTITTVDYKLTSLTEVSGPTSNKAPEIDPAAAASGLALLIGSVLVLCGRKAS